jgi:hypothetical protein
MAGTGPLTLTVNGTNFLPSTTVQVGGTMDVTSYVSGNQLTVTVTAAQVASGAQLSVVAWNGSASSAAVYLQVNNPVPAITQLTPATLTTGTASLMVTVTGTGFVSTTVIDVNGSTRTTTYVSATQLNVTLTAADVAAAGSLSLTAVNAAPGGGTSSAVSFPITAPPTFLTSINLPANHIVWDSTHGILYASLPSTDTNGNSVVAINLVSGTVGTPQAAGSEPDPLAISSDDSYLYVGLDGTGAVERFILPSLTLDTSLSLQLPVSPIFGQQVALSLEVAPGSPHTTAAILGNYSWGPPNTGGTIVYDDATPRSANIPYYDAEDSSLQWGATTSILYANDAYNTGNDLFVMSANSNGLTLKSDYGYLVPTQYGRIHFDPSSGHIYADGGRVVDPATGNLVGTFNLSGLDASNSPLCALDLQHGLVFFLGQTSAQFSSGSGVTIQVFSSNTYQLLATIPVPGASGYPIDFLRWGNAGLVFNTSPSYFNYKSAAGPIYLVDGGFVTTAQPPDFTSGTTLTTLPSLTAISPQSAVAGSSELTLTVTGNNFGSGTNVLWNGTALPSTAVNTTELQATVPAADLTPGTALISVSGGSPSEPALTSLAFTIFPASSGTTTVTALNLAALDVAWDKTSSQLFLPVWSADPQYFNSIVAINPTTGSITKSVAVMPDPDLIRVTDDGVYLYTGYKAANWVTRLTLPNLGSSLTWPLGADPYYGPYYALDLQPAPGASQTTAVTLADHGTQPEEDGGITIFDNETARTSSLPGFGHAGGEGYDSLQWGASSSSLYAGDMNSAFYSLNVDSSGVTLGQKYLSAFSSSGMKIHYDAGTGYIYSDDGQLLNPANGTLVGTFSASDLLVPDSSLNRVFVLGQTSSQTGTSNYTIQSFNQTSFAAVSSITLSSLVGTPVAFIRWGNNGLALVTYNKNASASSGPAGMLYIISDPNFVN